ncbi:MAG TPA: MarR family transcriptional regulator [Myxococcota bacterium]
MTRTKTPPTASTSTTKKTTSTTMSPLHLDAQLCFAISRAARAMTSTYAPLLEPLGLTHPQYLVMLVLWEQDAQRVTDIGTRLHLDSGTLTPLLKRLEQRGLVERRRGVDDERTVFIHLTAEGRALRQRAEQIPEGMACKVALDVDEFVGLRAQLLALADRLRG